MIKKGFALIELLFATVIISSLAGYGISKVQGSVEETKEVSLSMDMVHASKIQTEQYVLNGKYIPISGFSGFNKKVVSSSGVSFPLSEGNSIDMNPVTCSDGSSGFFGSVSNPDVSNTAYMNSCESSTVVLSDKKIEFENSSLDVSDEVVSSDEASEKVSKENGNGNSNNPEDDNSDNGIDEDSKNTEYSEEELAPIENSGVLDNSPVVSDDTQDKVSKENGNGNSNNPEDDNSDNGIDEDSKITVVETPSFEESLVAAKDPNLLDSSSLDSALAEVKAMKSFPFSSCNGSEQLGTSTKVKGNNILIYQVDANYFACLK